jgi:hypothetical protein
MFVLSNNVGDPNPTLTVIFDYQHPLLTILEKILSCQCNKDAFFLQKCVLAEVKQICWFIVYSLVRRTFLLFWAAFSYFLVLCSKFWQKFPLKKRIKNVLRNSRRGFLKKLRISCWFQTSTVQTGIFDNMLRKINIKNTVA